MSATPQNKGSVFPSPSRFALALSSLFFGLDLVNLFHHSLWRDEMQVWILTRHSHSFWEMLRLKSYEDIGHPDGWHMLVYPVSRLTADPIGLQLLHLALATLTVYLIARYSPFPRWQNVLIVFGYFLFYEYAIVSHDYALGVLAIFAFCAVYRPGPRKNYLALAMLLAVMAESNIYALMVGLSFVAGMIVEALGSVDRREYVLPNAWRRVAAAVLFLAVAFVSVQRMQAPADSGFVRPWHFPLDTTSFGRTLAMMWKTFAPVPQFSAQFWNSNIVPGAWVSVLSIAVLLVSILFFVRKPVVLSMYISGLGLLLFFRHAKYAGFLRNDGHAFILFLACMWLAYGYPEKGLAFPGLDRVGQWFAPYRRPVFAGILAVQVVAALIASVIAFRVPFSEAKATADFLRSQHMDQMYIVGDPDAPLLTVAGYLGRDIYYVRGNRMGSYVKWDGKRFPQPKETALQAGEAKAAERQEDVLVIQTRPEPITDPSVRKVAAFTGSAVGSEDFYVYEVQAKLLAQR